MHVERLMVGKLAANCFIVGDQESKRGIVIDPGSEAEQIMKRIDMLEYKIDFIVLTHGHFDHVGGAVKLKALTGAEIVIHHLDEEMIENPDLNCSSSMVGEQVAFKPDRTVGDRDIIMAGRYKGQIMHTPGHTPGGICIYFDEAKEVFVGDTLFFGSVGRTDLPGGSRKSLIESLQTKLMKLDDDVAVHTGHGSSTTIGFERRKNPYIQG